MGINLGDIIIDGEDAYGDGVNVAARLEQLAQPGDVCIARNVYNEIKNKTDLAFRPAGEYKVKNIPEPLMVYRLTADRGALARTLGLGRASAQKWRWAGLAAAAFVAVVVGTGVWAVGPRQLASLAGLSSSRVHHWELPAEPSIAVLPFANLTNDPQEEYFVDGITSDIITDLSRFSILFVTAATSTFHYKGQAVKLREVARGWACATCWRAASNGSAIRSENAQLIDAVSGHHMWAEHYDQPAQDLFALQKDITRNIVGTIGSESGGLMQAELDRIAHSSTDNLTAYDFYLRVVAHDLRRTKEDNVLARQMFEQAIRADPNYARAIAALGDSYLQDVWGDWAESREQALLRAEKFARQAIEVDSSEPWGYAVLGFAYQLRARNDQAIPLIEKAHSLNSNDYHITYALGYAHAYAGSPERGIGLIEQAHRLNPRHPEESLRNLAEAYFFAHRYQDAIATLSRVARRHRTSYWLYLAASHAQLEQMEQARAAIAEALKLDPTLTLAAEIKRREENGLAPASVEHLREALRKAGMPG